MEHLPKSDIDLKDLLLMGFRRSSDVMFYSDPDGVILNVNDAFTAHYGYTRGGHRKDPRLAALAAFNG